MIPNDLADLLLQKGLVIEKVLFVNSTKERYTLLVKKNLYEFKAVLKWQNPAKEIHLSKIVIEINYYIQNHDVQFIPSLFDFGDNWLLIEYYENSTTLRTFFMDYLENKSSINNKIDNEFTEIIDNYFKLIRLLNVTSKSNLDSDLIFKSLFSSQFNTLFFSVPDAKERQIIAKWLRKLTYFRSYYSIKKVKSYFDSKYSEYKFSLVHGDLHLNNILLSGNRMFVIDWENTRIGSNQEDLLYSLSFILNLLHDKKHHKNYVYGSFLNYISEIDSNDYSITILDFLLLAISVNIDFAVNLGYFQHLLRLLRFNRNIKRMMRLYNI